MICHLIMIMKNNSFHFPFKFPKLYQSEAGKVDAEPNFVLHKTHLMVQPCRIALKILLRLSPGNFSSIHSHNSSLSTMHSNLAYSGSLKRHLNYSPWYFPLMDSLLILKCFSKIPLL